MNFDDDYDNTLDPAVENELQFTLEQGSDPYPAMRPRGINRRHLILGAAVGIMVMFLVIIVIGTAVSTYFIFNHSTKTQSKSILIQRYMKAHANYKILFLFFFCRS
jgi:hypothetical protein